MSSNTNHKPQVLLLASPASSAGVLYGLYDVLSTVGAAYADMVSGELADELLDVKIISKSKEPFRCLGNVTVEPHLEISEIDKADAVVVCDMYAPIDEPANGKYDIEAEWLNRIYSNGGFLSSVCSGSTVLLETGLLHGLEVSGHWAYRHMVTEHYPDVKWREDSIINFSGEHKRIITTGGVTSWQDLAIYLVERFCGIQHARYTAKVHLLSVHTDGQLPFAAMTERNQTSDGVVSKCQEWIKKNLDSPNPVASMTKLSGLTAATFARRFKDATSYQPIEYVQGLRIENAKDLLASGDLAIDDISVLVGYEDSASFRRLFKRKVGITPSLYRKKFAQIGNNLTQ